MAYGAFNVGSGASTYDLDMLAAEVINGCVNTPLTTADGIAIAAQNGKQIVAHALRSEQTHDDTEIPSVVAGLVHMIETVRDKSFAEKNVLAAGIIRGVVPVQLMTADGNPICISGGKPLLAYRVKEDQKSYTDKAIIKAIAEFYATMEWYQAQNLAMMQTLVTERYMLAADIMRGVVSAPLITRDGNLIYLSNDEPLFACRVEEDEKSYADMAVTKAFAELSATVERYQAQNLAAMQALIASLVSGQLFVSMTNTEGTAVITHSGADIAAVKNL